MVRILDSFKYGVFAAALAFGAVGCDDETTPVTSPTTAKLPVSGGVATAVKDKKFTFSGGVSKFGTTAATDVTFTSASAATIASGGKSATTMLRFGSCIFTVTACTPPAMCPGSLATGMTVNVDPCTVTADANANTGTLALGSQNSGPTSLGDVTITCSSMTSCTVTTPSGTVTFTPPTGSVGG